MPLQDVERIIKKNKKYFDMLEEYDRTRRLPIEKMRRSFTLKRMTINKLKTISRETGISMSKLIDILVDTKLDKAEIGLKN